MLPSTISFQTIALTGGTGAGKGAVAEILRRYDIPTLDTDKVSRLVCCQGQPCLAALCEAFGGEILFPDGTLNRKGLAAMVFGETDPEKKKEKQQTLNRITHKYILDFCRNWLEEQKKNGFRAACIDAPQLFEAGFEHECDRIIGVTADMEVRIARVCARDDITKEAAQQRIAAQHDDTFFAAHCHAILENNGNLVQLEKAVITLLYEWGLL